MLIDQFHPRPIDKRRNLIVPGNYAASINFCVSHFVALAKDAIAKHGAFYVALSGGSTPKAIFEHLTVHSTLSPSDWSKIHLFWSDERAVPPTSDESNYKMAMDAGLSRMPIVLGQVHRMCAEKEIEENALQYEKTIQETLQGRPFDLIMLGMGDDGHTASLFPYTKALQEEKRLIVANYIPEKKVWRMTMTFSCIHMSQHIVVYVLGSSKKFMLSKIFSSSEDFEMLPAQRVGTEKNPSLWIADEAAAIDFLQTQEKRSR